MRTIRWPRLLLIAGFLMTVSGCNTFGGTPLLGSDSPSIETTTTSGSLLAALPPPAQAVDVAVYAFPDRTGQNASNDNFAEYSKAVTQGAASLLVDVLTKAGGGKWFNVVEREDIAALLNERDLINKTRLAFQGKHAEALPALRFAGSLIEGGIIGYDTDVTTGGAGARYLGIGADVQYRTDVVTVALRTVSVTTGRVLTSVTTSKTIFSVVAHGGLFKFVALDDLLELEGGVSKNEPKEIATREAIELAVMSTIVEGVENDLYAFADPAEGQAIISAYQAKYGTTLPTAEADQVAVASATPVVAAGATVKSLPQPVSSTSRSLPASY